MNYWTNEFKGHRTSIFDKDPLGRPNEDATSELIEKIHIILIIDRRLKVREISETVGISIERIQNHLDMKKLSVRQLP